MNAEMLKGHLDAIVLAALNAGPAHGYAIIEQIRRSTGGAFDLPEGTVYPALHRLEQAGLLRSDWTMTRDGKAALRRRKEDWRRFAAAVDHLLAGGAPCPA